MDQQIFPKLSGFKNLQFFLMSLDAAHHSWFHDAVLLMNVNHTEIQVAFGEVVGNAYYHDDVKMRGDCAKILKGKMK